MRPLDLIKRVVVLGALAVLLAAVAPMSVSAALTLVDIPHPQVPARYSGDQLLPATGDLLPSGAAAGAARTASGAGAWTVTADGGVLTSGDAKPFGSLAGQHLPARVTGIAATPSGDGYWLVTGDGAVFAFGRAPYLGSLAGRRVDGAVVAVAPTPSGHGYWLAAAGGDVAPFGDAPDLGHPSSSAIHGGVVGIAPTRSGRGYWITDAEGAVFNYGDAQGNRPPPARLRNARGNDVSWPQCDGPMPAAGAGFGIVGVTDGAPFTRNPCLGAEWHWATGTGAAAVYLNLASAFQGGPAEMHGPAGDCGINDLPCQTTNQAANTVGDALAWARANGVDAPMWWLDVETMNRWTSNQALNTLTVRAAIDALGRAGVRAGVYSTSGMWDEITGGARIGVPAWVAAIVDDAGAPALCESPKSNFTGGGVWLVQSLPFQFDVDYACPHLFKAPRAAFRFAG